MGACHGSHASFVLDDYYLLAATRYVEMNPVKAGLVDRPESYRWSSAGAHLSGRDDGLVKVAPLLEIVGDWKQFLSELTREEDGPRLQRHERTGRPLGAEGFVVKLEGIVGRLLRPKPGGRKPKERPKQVRCPPIVMLAFSIS